MADDIERVPDLDPGLRALVSAYETATARDGAHIDAALARVIAKASTGSGVAALSTTTKMGIVGGLAGVATLVGLVALGPSGEPASSRPVITETSSTAAEATAPPAVVETPPVVTVDVPSIAPSSGVDPVVDEAPQERSDRRARSEGSSRPRRLPESERTPAKSSLKAELELLRQARTALRRGRAEETLEIVRRHRREYPTSTIAAERDATEVSALCALGQLEEAACR